MSANYEELTYDVADRVAVITLNRPERLNALSLATVDELHAVFDRVELDQSVDVVILTGSGRSFCAGIDLNDGLDMWPEAAEQAHGRYFTQQRFSSLVVRMREIPQPVIAAVHGHAIGGGMALALAADIRIADETAKLNLGFVRIGLTGTDMGVSWFLPRIVGPSMAAELMYTGRFVEGQETLRIGLVSKLTPKGEDLSAAHALAAQILENTGFGVRLTKEALNQTFGAPSLQAMIEIENRSQVLCSLTQGFAEAMTDFQQRRTKP